MAAQAQQRRLSRVLTPVLRRLHPLRPQLRAFLRPTLMSRSFRCALTWCLAQAPAEEGGSKTSMTAVDLSGRKRPPSARVRLRPQSAGGVRVPKAVAPVNSGYSGAPSRGRVRSRPVSASASASGSSLWRSRPRGGIPHGEGGPGVKTTQRGGYAFPPVRSEPSCSCCLAPIRGDFCAGADDGHERQRSRAARRGRREEGARGDGPADAGAAGRRARGPAHAADPVHGVVKPRTRGASLFATPCTTARPRPREAHQCKSTSR